MAWAALAVVSDDEAGEEPGPREAGHGLSLVTRSSVRTGGAWTIRIVCIAAAALCCVLADNLGPPPARGRAALRAAVGSSIQASASPDAPWWEGAPEAAAKRPAPRAKEPEEDWFNTLASGVKVPAASALAPLATLNDGNVCEDDEELFPQNLTTGGALCYKRCSLLTAGGHPIRTSAWTCCASHPCTIGNQRHDAGLCSGFDVAGRLGSGEDGACPHKPGACLKNEELFLGVCYKQCRLLDPGFPIRTGPETCCKSDSGVRCLLPTGQGRTSVAFAVGGGAGDGDASTPSSAHEPLQALTERPI